MATKKKHKLKKKHNFKEEEVITALESIIERQLSDESIISFKMLLIEHKLYPQLIQHWEQSSEEVADLVKTMRAIREARYEETLLSRSEIPGVNILFYGKYALHLVEEQHRLRIEADTNNKIVDDDVDIKVGFDE